jgi:hypothetical protein
MKFDLKKLVDDVTNETEELFDYKPLQEFDHMPDSLLGDKDRIKYILFCLLKNAIIRNKFSLTLGC